MESGSYVSFHSKLFAVCKLVWVETPSLAILLKRVNFKKLFCNNFLVLRFLSLPTDPGEGHKKTQRDIRKECRGYPVFIFCYILFLRTTTDVLYSPL